MIAHSVDDPLYYLHNFRQVLRWVAQRHADLLDEPAQRFTECFPDLPQASQALLVRMVMRKGELFRSDRLVYPEVGALDAALAPLLALEWVCLQPELDLHQVFHLLRKDELVQCFAAHLSRPRAAKPELLTQVQAQLTGVRPLQGWFADAPLHIVHWRGQAMCDRLRLLFFGNLYQDWSEFVLADLGVFRYEQVAFGPESRALNHTDEVEQALALHACAEAFEQGEGVATLLPRLAALRSDNPWLARRRSRLLYHLGQHCERQAEWAQALEVYADCTHAQARIRSVRVLERQAQWQQAHDLAQHMAAAPANPLEVQALTRMLPRLARKLGGPPQRRGKAPALELLDLELPRELAVQGVERAVRGHLAEAGGEVHYVENTLFNSLFGLVCWDAIFAPIPGAFFHPFQSAPQDLHEADFQLRRAAQFNACFARLDDGSYRDSVRQCFAEKHGLQSPFVHWGGLNPTLLEQALTCLPAIHLKHAFQRLLLDIRNNRTGMPDLIQFWPEEGRYRMVEVKGPGDRLQDNQLRWLEFCREHGLPVAVAHVRWREAAA